MRQPYTARRTRVRVALGHYVERPIPPRGGASGAAGIARSARGWRRIEQGQLGGIGRLENGQPPLEVGATDRVAVPGRLRVSGLDAPPELVGRRVEEVQFDGDADAASGGSQLVTFAPRPEAEIEDDAAVEAQDLLGETPEFVFDLLPGGRI